MNIVNLYPSFDHDSNEIQIIDDNGKLFTTLVFLDQQIMIKAVDYNGFTLPIMFSSIEFGKGNFPLINIDNTRYTQGEYIPRFDLANIEVEQKKFMYLMIRDSIVLLQEELLKNIEDTVYIIHNRGIDNNARKYTNTILYKFVCEMYDKIKLENKLYYLNSISFYGMNNSRKNRFINDSQIKFEDILKKTEEEFDMSEFLEYVHDTDPEYYHDRYEKDDEEEKPEFIQPDDPDKELNNRYV